MSIAEELRKLQEKADLTRRFPGYFRKYLFRAAFFFSFFYFCAAAVVAGPHVLTGYISASCPDDALTGKCFNPYYYCAYGTLDERRGIVCPDNERLLSLCNKTDLCQKKYLSPGETVGEVPPAIVSLAGAALLISLLFAFALNHLLYLVKGPTK